MRCFWPQIQSFLLQNFFQLFEFEDVDLKLTIFFFRFKPKKTKSGIFGLKFKEIYFCTEPCNNTNFRVLISSSTIAFQNCCPRHPNEVFLVPNLRIFIFAQKFEIKQIRGRWFQI